MWSPGPHLLNGDNNTLLTSQNVTGIALYVKSTKQNVCSMAISHAAKIVLYFIRVCVFVLTTSLFITFLKTEVVITQFLICFCFYSFFLFLFFLLQQIVLCLTQSKLSIIIC